MDEPTLPSDLTFQDTFTFQAPIDAVFDALWAQPGGTLLELRHITGTHRSIGHQQQARIAFGGVDLLMIETVTALTHPSHLQIAQRPDGLTRHDPVERDIPFLDSLVEDLDGAFIRQFGADPAATQIDFKLSEHASETHVQIELEVLNDQHSNWLGRRTWRKKVMKEAAEIAAGIGARLQVQ